MWEGEKVGRRMYFLFARVVFVFALEGGEAEVSVSGYWVSVGAVQ